MCGLAWRARRPLPLEIVDMQEAKLEEGIVAASFSPVHYREISSCGVVGDMVQTGGFVTISLSWVPVQARKGADLP